MTAALILSVAAGARLAMIFTTSPLLSDDIGRYIHDGWHLSEGTHPYAQSPSEASRLGAVGKAPPQGYQPPIENINNPDLITIYQPTSQYVFAGLGLISHVVWEVIEPDRVFRLGFVAIDLCLVGLLLLALHQAGRRLWWAALYAWHPLAITEVAWSGHQDVIGIAALVGALWLAGGAKPRAGGAIGSGLLFALAIGVKPLVLPLALPLAWALRRHGRLIPLAAGVTVAGVAALYLPLMLWEPGLSGLFETVRVFVGGWASNASLHRAAELAFGDKLTADWTMGVLLVLVLVVATFTTDHWRAAMVFLFAAVLLSSTAHPWYLLWALALTPLRFSASVWVLSLTITLAYTAWFNGSQFQPLRWSVWAAYAPVYAVLVIELKRFVSRQTNRGQAGSVGSRENA